MLSGKIPIKPLEQDRQSSPENATFHKFYSIEYEIELLLQTKFEFIKGNRVQVWWKTNDSLASKPDVMMKPVHDVTHPQMYHLKNKATSKAEYSNTQQGLPD